MDNDRLIHSLAVANKMVEVGKKRKLTELRLEELFVLGYLHDIGYRFDDGDNHGVVGGNILKASNYKYWKEIYYHGVPSCEYKSLYLDILNYADMSIDKYGNDVGFDYRIIDIKKRYGENSRPYIYCVKLIDELKEMDL